MAPSIAYDAQHDHQITVSEYIYRRILQLGIHNIFGVPGDFVLDFCEEISKTPDLQWVGTCNELNGSYAADGYARISGKLGVLVTTFGVGELSALNGVAGSFLEYLPVLHIVGTSSRVQKSDGRHYHHLIPQLNSTVPDHYVYEKMITPISVVQESLFDMAKVTRQIDHAIEQVWINSRPGYIFLPSDMATCYVPYDDLSKPLQLTKPISNPQSVKDVTHRILDKLYQSQKPAIIVDYLCKPFRQLPQINNLLFQLQDKINIFSTSMSKGYINQSHPRFSGVYSGKLTPFALTLSYIEDADFVLDIGAFDVQCNNGSFSCKYKENSLISLGEHNALIGGEVVEIGFIDILLCLCEMVDLSQIPLTDPIELPSKKSTQPTGPLCENYLSSLLESFLQPNDIVVVETCSFMFSIPDMIIPDSLRIIGQFFYNSIGYALPATIGASIDNKELGFKEHESRVVLIQGDGSLLMTLQELTTMMRQDIKLTILLLNNEGYTVERAILGPQSLYNDIPLNIQWTRLFELFGDVEGKTVNKRVGTNMELHNLFKNSEFCSGEYLQMCELVLDKLDVPDSFLKIVGK